MHEFSICQTLVAAVLKELGRVEGEDLAEPCEAKNNIPACGKLTPSINQRTTKPGLAKKGKQIRLKKVRVAAGQYHRIVPASLKLAYKILIKDTPAEGSSLLIKTVPIKLKCNQCGWKSSTRDISFVCRKCGGVNIEIIGGKELFLESIEVESVHGQEFPATTMGGSASGGKVHRPPATLPAHSATRSVAGGCVALRAGSRFKVKNGNEQS